MSVKDRAPNYQNIIDFTVIDMLLSKYFGPTHPIRLQLQEHAKLYK